MPTLNDEISSFLLLNGASLVGFANLHEIDTGARDGSPFGISIAIALNPKIMAGIREGPTRAYYDEYNSVNYKLDKLGEATAAWLQDKGYQAQAQAATHEENQSNLTARLPHKTVATRAGLGWIGKCALLVTKRFGSAVRLTTVLTDAPLAPGRPLNESLCSHCTHCTDACPAQAITGTSWKAGIPRESLVDVYACRKKQREMTAKLIGESHSICGLCIVACPWTRKYLERAGL
jgi:epoxyqueuosine reductase